MTLGPYNQGVYNNGIYNFPDIQPNVSLQFDGVDEYLENTLRQSLGVANLWSITLWMRPFETTTIFDNEGKPLFRPDGKALLHFKGATHKNEVLIWGDRVENSVNEDFIVVENWDDTNSRIRVTRFNMAQKRQEWRLFSCAWNGENLIAWNNGQELTDFSETVSGVGSFIQIDPNNAEKGRSIRVAAAYSGIATSLDGPRLVSYSGLLGPVAVWDDLLTGTEFGEIASGTFGFNLTTDSGTYASSANLQHWWRLGANTDAVGFDFAAMANPIDISGDATVSGTNVIADFP